MVNQFNLRVPVLGLQIFYEPEPPSSRPLRSLPCPLPGRRLPRAFDASLSHHHPKKFRKMFWFKS